MKQTHSHLDPRHHVDAIKSTDEYRTTLQEVPGEVLNPKQKLQRRNKAIARSAQALAEFHTSESGYQSPEGTRYELISQLEPFYHAQVTLNQLRSQGHRLGQRVPRETKLPYLKIVTRFNHALKEVLDNDSSLMFDDLLLFMTRMYAGANGVETAQEFHDEARGAMDGMRHEIGAEQIVGVLGLDYDEASVDDDLKGVDRFIHIDGEIVPIDFKASENKTERARRKSFHPEHIVWSQLHDADFQGGFRISNEVAHAKAPAMLAELKHAAHPNTHAYAAQL